MQSTYMADYVAAKPYFWNSFINQIEVEYCNENRFLLRNQDTNDYNTTFATEVQCLMTVYGDVRIPIYDTVLTFVKYLHIHLKTVLGDANWLAKKHGDKFLEHESIIFLFRRNKEKVQRLLNYMRLKDSISTGYINYGATIAEEGPHVRMVMDCLKEIFTPEEVTIIQNMKELDPLSKRTVQRMDRRTKRMSEKERIEFSDKQKTSFEKNDINLFKDWLINSKLTTLIPTPRSLQIIIFLVRDYISQVVDKVLMQRERSRRLCQSHPDSPRIRSSYLKEMQSRRSDDPPTVISSILSKYRMSPWITNYVLAFDPDELKWVAQKVNDWYNPVPYKEIAQAVEKRNKPGPSAAATTNKTLSKGESRTSSPSPDVMILDIVTAKPKAASNTIMEVDLCS